MLSRRLAIYAGHPSQNESGKQQLGSVLDQGIGVPAGHTLSYVEEDYLESAFREGELLAETLMLTRHFDSEGGGGLAPRRSERNMGLVTGRGRPTRVKSGAQESHPYPPGGMYKDCTSRERLTPLPTLKKNHIYKYLCPAPYARVDTGGQCTGL